MSTRSYRQSCALAGALDVVGDRWTMLILRDLLGGSARFADLQRSLTGIAPNLLADRLRKLRDANLVVQRTTEHAIVVYELTSLGAEARPALEQLGRLGMLIGASQDRPAPRPGNVRGLAMAMQAMLNIGGTLPPGRLGLQLDDEWLTIEVAGDIASVRYKPPDEPFRRIAISYEILREVMIYHGDIDQLSHNAEGDSEAVAQLTRAFSSARQLLAANLER